MIVLSQNCKTWNGCSNMAKAISLSSVIPMKSVRQYTIATKAIVIGLGGPIAC